MSKRFASDSDPLRHEVYELADALLSGSLTAEEAQRLERLISSDPNALRHYVRFMHDSATLSQWGRDSSGAESSERPVDAAIEPPHQPEPRTLSPESPLSLHLHSYPPPPSTPFIGGPVFSYMVATVILGVMLISAWAYKISHDQQQIVKGTQSIPANDRRQLVFTGRITGMKDCQWSDPRTMTSLGSAVPLGRRYALSSGLMEITYDSGAKVILEGPCTYQVESDAGGYLAWEN